MKTRTTTRTRVRYPDGGGRKLSDRDLAHVSAVVERKLMNAYISDASWAEGLRWYQDAHQYARRLADEYDRTVEDMAYVIAVLSPMNRWEQNKLDARSMLDTGTCGALPLGVDRAFDIIANRRRGVDVAGGRKVRAFGANIANPHSSLDVTLDTWMVQFLNIDINYLQRKGVYDAISAAFRRVAARMGVMPHQLQAAVWIEGRGDHE